MKLVAPKFWRRRGVLAMLLYPASLFYGGIMWLRRWYYQKIAPPAQLMDWLNQRGVKVLVVGNLTVGGVGKTPLVARLAAMFAAHSIKVAVVMRGYQGKAPYYPYLVNKNSTPQTVGDEACMLFQATGLPVVVDPQRARAVRYLAERGYQLILSDDGLQHYKTPRHGELIVFSAARGFGNRWVLPAGPLREPCCKRFLVPNWLVANYDCQQLADGNDPQRDSGKIDGVVDFVGVARQIYAMRIVPQQMVNLANMQIKQDASCWRGARVVAVAAIGDPAKFFHTLTALGLVIERSFSYPDHYNFAAQDYRMWGNGAVVMTAKDAVKIAQPADNWWYLSITASLSPALERQLLDWWAR